MVCNQVLALFPDTPGSPFFDNDAHITHFTRRGMLAMARGLGLREAEYTERGTVGGFAFGNDGVS